MATYSKLLLSTGGGIISQTQQAEQVQNTASVLIGLGGTGVDCIAEIKKAVRERLKPDDVDALVPEYKHIRFLAVDTDKKNAALKKGFSGNEVFDISNPNVKQALKSKAAIESRRELDWLDSDRIDTADIADAGAGGFRQAGRYMLMDRSNAFLDRVKEVIRAAKLGAGNASLYIHVFSGLAGGTGAGTFLDACYLIRKALEEENGTNGKIFGYFFLPDVNLDKIPTSATLVRDYVPRNGYASMQELDYCMSISRNGGSFTQLYKGGKPVDWNEAPVDMCHLICSTDQNRQVIPNAYSNAMHVATEYVMDFLTSPMVNSAEDGAEDGAASTDFDILSHLSNFTAQVMAADERKDHGYNLNYCVIGASCASIPMRKINTYLAARVFEAFSDLDKHVPTETEVQALAQAARVASVDTLLQEISRDADSSLTPAPDSLDWTFVRDNGDKQLLYHYTNQKAEKVGNIEKNAQSMMDEKNAQSLVSRICSQLDACAKDLSRGPAYAAGVVQASMQGNLLNVIDGLLENVKSRTNQRNYNLYEQAGNTQELYNQSRQYWLSVKDSGGLSKSKPKKAFNQYVYDMEDLISGQIELEQLKQLSSVLTALRKQLENRAADYYQKFARVMNNLVSTFSENMGVLNDTTIRDDEGAFAIPLVTIDEIRPNLDAVVEKMDMPGLLNQFVSYMFGANQNGKPVWAEEDEDSISRAVKEFFVRDIFNSFADRSITQFLADKYHTTNNQEITNKLYNEYMLKLKDRSEALFPVNGTVWDSAITSEIAYVSVPSTAQVVIDAAQKLYAEDNRFGVKTSALRDRIYIMRCSVALPIGAYANAELYESQYFQGAQAGRHYYIGKGGSDLFNNWQKLPSLIPLSLIDGHVPAKLQEILTDSDRIYRAAKAAGLIQGDAIMKLTSDAAQSLEQAMNYAASAKQKAESSGAQRALILQDSCTRLQAALDGLTYENAGYSIPKGSVATPAIEERIREDYFVSSPALQTMVREDMERIAEVKKELQALKEEIESANRGSAVVKNFCEALFTGVIAWNMTKVTYTKTEFGIPTETALSDFQDRARFPYAQLPLYQAYLSYQALGEDEKKEMREASSQKMGALDPATITVINSYKTRITEQFNMNFVQTAQAFPNIYQDACSFIKSLNLELRGIVAMLQSFGL